MINKICKLILLKKFALFGKYCFSAMVFFLIAFSCTTEEGINNASTSIRSRSGEEKEIVFSMNVPAVTDATPQLRSIDASQENTIKTIDLVAFRTDNTGSYFDYSYPGTLAADNTPGASTQKCIVKVRLASYTQNLVIITNAGTAVSDLVAKTALNTSKETFLANLEYALPQGSSWNAISASNYAALPMWGETTASINQNTTQLSASLLRMLAKIDVQLDPTKLTQLQSVFKIKSVNIYNTLTNGRIVPNSANVLQSGNNLSVTAPTLPATPGKYLGPLVYRDFSAPGVTDVSMKGAIYTFETKAPADTSALSALDATCVVVGGLYGTDTKESYYRVDFLQNGKFQDILRNHRYVVNITDVLSGGYPTPDEAYRNRGMNMAVKILTWDENGMTDVTFGGQWYLSVSSHDISLPRNAETDSTSLSVLTDYNPLGSSTTGWYVKSITDSVTHTTPTWLTVFPMQGPPNTLKNVKLTTQLNTTNSSRTATIVFAAGRLEYPVTVRQTLIDRPTITINYYTTSVGAEVVSGELNFTFSSPTGLPTPPFQGIQVTVTPATINMTMYRTDVQGVAYSPFTIAPDAGVITTSSDGTHIMTVTPPKVTVDDIVNGAYLREELLVMSATNGPYTVTKTLVLKYMYTGK